MAAIELNVTSIGRINSISDTSLNNTYAVVYNSSTGTPLGFEMDIIVDMDASLVAAHADIAAVELGLSNEITARGNADDTLQTNINNEATTRQQDDQTEAGVRANADTLLDEKIKNTSTGHDHDGVDSRVVDHDNLANKGTNTHAQIDAHIASTTNPHGVTKSQVGLGNVDNTSDANKPVSTAQANAIATKVGLTGNETVAGIKTFSSFPITPSSAPTTNYQAANKKYVDDADTLKENVANKKTVLNASATEYPASSIVKSTIEDNELTVAESIAMLFHEIDGIKDLLSAFVASTITVDTLTVMTALNLFGETNIIIKATTAPIPDFIGQFFINTTSAPYVGYIAIGTASVSDWKQITN